MSQSDISTCACSIVKKIKVSEFQRVLVDAGNERVAHFGTCGWDAARLRFCLKFFEPLLRSPSPPEWLSPSPPSRLASRTPVARTALSDDVVKSELGFGGMLYSN